MLYDQAQLAVVYSIAVQITGSIELKDTVEDILDYVSRDLTHPAGGFYTAEDADSYPTHDSKEKKEGAFCVWYYEDLKNLLSDKIDGTDHTLADVFINHYNAVDGGNVNPRMDPHGELTNQNVLTILPEKDSLVSEEVLKDALAKAKNILYEKRQTRPRPSLDDKILTSSNGLMISGFCTAGRALERDDYITTAVKSAEFILKHLVDVSSGKLLRSCYGNSAHSLEQLSSPVHGFIDDYAFTVQAMIDLYASTFDDKWLKKAIELQELQDNLFLDKSEGGYFAAEEGASDIVIRLKDDHDGAEPSSNSISAMNLIRLYKLTNNENYKTQAEKIFKLFDDRLTQIPISMSALVETFLFYKQDGPILILKPEDKAFVTAVHKNYFPFLTCLGLSGQTDRSMNPKLADITFESGQAALLIKYDGDQVVITSIDDLKQNLE